MQNKANKETLYNILDSLDTPIYVSDPDTYELLYVNRKLRSIYGVADPRGETCWKLLGQTTAPCPDCPCPELKKNPSKAIVAEGKNPQNNHTYSRTDTFIDWHDGRVVHMRHSTDVTDARMSRERVEKYIKELELATLNSERANNAKRDFLSRMSHEIRTPMNAIIGMAHIAGTSSDQEKVKRCIEKINSSSKQLLSIINDILDMSNIEAAKFELSNEKFDLEKMLIDVCNLITAKAEERQQNFQISIDKDVEKYYVGDSMRLSQVIINLLTNAVKFSPENSDILLNISKISAGEKNATLKFEVIDHGIGISRENLAKLFVPFEQGDGSISRRYGGTGLGLAICKSIVNLMNGNISAESEEG
ncbi:MAG: hypothetical protein LBS99_01655, partial [Clostridiales bacterium]|nr:hypothetical protein [Clostridiales bacterium]